MKKLSARTSHQPGASNTVSGKADVAQASRHAVPAFVPALAAAGGKISGLVILWLVAFVAPAAFPATHDYDLVVYGGTAGGVATAVAGAREGLATVLLEPRDHVGGMVTGGLSWSDTGKEEVIGGIALEFAWRVGNKYQARYYRAHHVWAFEPKVAEEVLREMLADAGVEVLYRHRLREDNGVRKTGTRITSIITENGAEFEGKIFADCSYEGDLMAQAGVSYTWGREAMSKYGESLAGVRDRTPLHQFTVDVNPRDNNGKLLPHVHDQPREKAGTADKKVQAYNFRMILSSEPSNQTPFPRPANYDPARYELLARLLAAEAKAWGRSPVMNEVVKVDRIPNAKADINNKGAFSTDHIGGSWEYPEASYQRKAEIWQDHAGYVMGLFYFLANDARVPKPLRDEVNGWGLAKDEFTDTGNWPHQLYIREARRMVGEFVVTQKDLQTELTKPDPIGMGSYNSDSHNIQRIVNERGVAENEGDMQVPVRPYQIPYRVMLPTRGEAVNLLVPVAFSASHVAYSSLRMEPQYMIIGQAAGVAAQMAIAGGKTVHGIDTRALTAKLKAQGAIMEYVPSPRIKAINLFRKMFCGPRVSAHGLSNGATANCP